MQNPELKTLKLDLDTLNTGFRPMRVLTLNCAQNLKFPGFWLAVRNSAHATLIIEF